jgi:hypothetical protein
MTNGAERGTGVFRRGAGHGNSPLPIDTAPAFYPTRMRESRLSGSVEGVVSNHDLYSDSREGNSRNHWELDQRNFSRHGGHQSRLHCHVS